MQHRGAFKRGGCDGVAGGGVGVMSSNVARLSYVANDNWMVKYTLYSLQIYVI